MFRVQLSVLAATFVGVLGLVPRAHAAVDPARFEYVTIRANETVALDRAVTSILDTFVADETARRPGRTHFLEGRFIVHFDGWPEAERVAIVRRLREVLHQRATLDSTYDLGTSSWFGFTTFGENEFFPRLRDFGRDAARTPDDRIIYPDRFLKELCEETILAPTRN